MTTPPGVTGRAKTATRDIAFFVLFAAELERSETERRLRLAAKKGETWVFVPWPHRWRMITNLSRWDVPGLVVQGY